MTVAEYKLAQLGYIKNHQDEKYISYKNGDKEIEFELSEDMVWLFKDYAPYQSYSYELLFAITLRIKEVQNEV